MSELNPIKVSSNGLREYVATLHKAIQARSIPKQGQEQARAGSRAKQA